MKAIYPIAYLGTQADIDANKANNLPSGSQIIVVDSGGTPTGVEYKVATSGQAPVQSAAGIKNNFAATVAPTATDDSSKGYSVGSRWIDITGKESYICVGAAVGAAEWTKTTVGTIAEVSGLQTALDNKANDTDVVKNTGDQTIAGKKTFSTIPEVLLDATINNQLMRKSQIDTALTGKSNTSHTHPYEPANTNIQLHISTAHAPSNAEQNIQVDWNQTNNTLDDFIKNKPTIPAAQVNSDWSAASGIAQILNKPSSMTPTAHKSTHASGNADVLSPADIGAETTLNKKIVFQATPTDTAYPSEKLVKDSLTLKEATTNKGVANGYAGLGADARVPFAQLPESVGIGFRLWTPSDLAGVRAIDVDFESATLGSLSTIINTGSLGGTSNNATGAEQPTIDMVDPTGHRGALFDGINDSLRSSAIWNLGTTYGIFTIYRRAASGAGFIISTEYPSNVAYTLGQANSSDTMASNSVFVGHFNGAWRNYSVGNITAGNLCIVVGNFDGSNFNVRLFGTDNISAQTSLSGTPSSNTRIGRRWDLGGNDYFAGRIFRIIGKIGAFTTAEMQLLEGWAAHRFSMASSLPSSHPYRNNPPIVAL